MLKAGMSIIDITPEKGVQLGGYPHCPRPNEGVHDRLYASCMFLDNGTDRVAIVAMDIFFFTKRLCTEIRSKFDFDISFTASHTHSAPNTGLVHDFEKNEGVFVDEAFVSDLVAKVEKIIKEAHDNTFDAEFGSYVGHCGAEQGVGGNRREKGGVCDPSVNILAVRDSDKKIRGILLNYALHPTYLHADNVLVSADYPGGVRNYIHFAFPDAIFMFAQGTIGNQSSRYHRLGQTFEEACRVGTTLGVEIFHCIGKMEFTDKLDIGFKHTFIDLPRRTFASSAEAKPGMEKARERFASLHDADYITMRNAELDMFGAEDLYYLALEIEDGKAESVYADLLPCEIELITLNDTAIVGTQGELFVEYGLAIKARSKYKKTFVFNLTNGELPGYVYTPDAIGDGGYEVGNSIFAPEAGAETVKAAEKLLNGEE